MEKIAAQENLENALKNDACFNINKLSNKLDIIYNNKLKKANISYRLFVLLVLLKINKDKEEIFNIKTLARNAGIDRSTISRNLKVLKRIGFVTILPFDVKGKADFKNKYYQLSENGEKLVLEYSCIFEECKKSDWKSSLSLYFEIQKSIDVLSRIMIPEMPDGVALG